MYVVRFSLPRVNEHSDPRMFEQRASRLLVFREAENSYVLGCLPGLLARAAALPPGARVPERMFTIEEDEVLLSAGILFENGCLAMTWADEQVANVLAEFMAERECRITSIVAPSYFSWKFAEKWAQLTRQQFEFGRSERVYQLARCSFRSPATGRLELATKSDSHFLLPWVDAFIQESGFETFRSHEALLDDMISHGLLYLWKVPEPVSMAAWLSPTPNGGSINFVYTLPAFRRQGHAKAVVSALSSLMLSRGRKYCFILTDTEDARTNRLYQSIGAVTYCEMMRCLIHAPVVATTPLAQNSHLMRAGRLSI